MPQESFTESAFQSARDHYATLGVDVDAALNRLASLPISLHCWQGDDVGGFESRGEALGGGLAVTGSYPGKARTPDELRQDLDKALSLIPGTHRLNLHASYGDFGGQKVDRDTIETAHYQEWIDWAKSRNLGLDFNPTCFSHPKAAEGFTLSSNNPGIREFWIEHCRRTRAISSDIGAQLGKPVVHNIWIPDGWKDTPADRLGPRERLRASLDTVLEKPVAHVIDTVESKLFGIGSEAYVVGSHEFYLGYAVERGIGLCLDMGHFHPTESVADKLSSVLLFVKHVLLHVSRGLRWDSDHVVICDDALQAMGVELARLNAWEQVSLGLDYFDASINRVAAYVIGTRAFQQAILFGLLQPDALLRGAENAGNLTERLALQEAAKQMPWGAVWNAFCALQNVPEGASWLADVQAYERAVLSKRT